jgi:predicted nucleic-acid-binding protein
LRGIDTNILVRLITADDPAQLRAVEALMDRVEIEDDRLHIDSVTPGFPVRLGRLPGLPHRLA